MTAVSLRGGRDAAWPDHVRTVALDRDADGAPAAALGDDCDLLVDLVGCNGAHARRLTALTGRIGSAVVVSSGAVYTDTEGRGFDTAGEPGGDPLYPVPIPEDWTTVEPDDSTYATRTIQLERALLSAGEALPVTVLRAGAVHGRTRSRRCSGPTAPLSLRLRGGGTPCWRVTARWGDERSPAGVRAAGIARRQPAPFPRRTVTARAWRADRTSRRAGRCDR